MIQVGLLVSCFTLFSLWKIAQLLHSASLKLQGNGHDIVFEDNIRVTCFSLCKLLGMSGKAK